MDNAATAQLRLPRIDDSAIPSLRLVRHAVSTVFISIAALLLGVGAAAFLVEMTLTVDADGVMEQREVWPVRPLEPGLVTAVLVATGDTVRRGQPVARMDTTDPAAAVRAMRHQLRAGEQDLRRAAATIPLNLALQAEKVADGEARILRANAELREQLVNAGLRGDADAALRGYVAGTNTRIDMALAEVRAAEAGLRSARASLEMARLDSQDLARRRLDLARTRDELAYTAREVERLTVLAPSDGIVLTDQLQRLVGGQVAAGEQIMELADTSGWRTVLYLGERHVHDVEVGQDAMVEIPALKQLDGRRLVGRVVSVAQQPVLAAGGAASAPPGTYRVVVVLEESQLAELGANFRRGYAVRGKIVTRRDRIAQLVAAHVRDRINKFR